MHLLSDVKPFLSNFSTSTDMERDLLVRLLLGCATWQLAIGQIVNLLTNPSFEDELAGNWDDNGFTLERHSLDSYHGSYSVKCTDRYVPPPPNVLKGMHSLHQVFWKVCTPSTKCSERYVLPPPNVLKGIYSSTKCSEKYTVLPQVFWKVCTPSTKCSERYVLPTLSVLKGMYSLHQVFWKVCTPSNKCSERYALPPPSVLKGMYSLHQMFWKVCTPSNKCSERYAVFWKIRTGSVLLKLWLCYVLW